MMTRPVDVLYTIYLASAVLAPDLSSPIGYRGPKPRAKFVAQKAEGAGRRRKEAHAVGA